MARRTTSTASGRSRITSPSKDLVSDDASFLISVINGEQLQLGFTLSWLVNMTGMTITAKIVEGDNSVLGTKPTVPASTPVITTLPVIDTDITDNSFSIVIPQNLIASWGASPLPNLPVYGFFGIEIADTGVGDAQQIYKPVRGLVEVLYSPTEAV